jgi:hypothetical protein
MLNTLIFVAIFVVIWNRWSLFERFLGTTGMYLADTVLCTVLAAANFASPGPSLFFSYMLAVLMVLFAIFSGWSFLRRLNK